MAIITKIREKSGWAIGVIAICLGLFVLGADLFRPNSANPAKRIVGEIAGEDVRLEDFNKELETAKANYSLMRQTAPTEAEMPQLREQAWNQMITKIAYQNQYDALGIEVSEDEVVDMVQGNNIHPSIVNSFKNPENGQIDRVLIKNFLQNIDNYSFEQQVAYYNFERRLRPDRLKSKYEGMLNHTIYATKAQAKREYTLQNTKASFQYVYIPYSSIPDAQVSATQSQLKNYYSAHKKQYEQKASVSIEYVSFPIQYTDTDEAAIIEEIKSLVPPFERSQNDSAFVDANSDNLDNFKLVNPGGLPPIILSEGISIGKVYEPVREGQSYTIYKLVADQEDTLYSARASHILFDAKNKTEQEKAKVKIQAQKILKQIKNGADFAKMAAKHGTDGTKNKGGDLGWFREGAMVTPFNDAVMKCTKLGLLPNLVQTQFGYHIIKVTEIKNKTNYLVASIKKEIQPSDQTVDAAYKRAGRFARGLENYEDFKAAVKKDSTLIRLQALDVSPEAKNINNITSAGVRQILIWACTDADQGTVSRIFELDDQFVIATLISKKEKGTSDFEEVEQEIRRKVNKQLKRDKILAKLDSIKAGKVSEIADAYGQGAKTGSSTDLTFAGFYIQEIGFSPELMGKIFTVPSNTTSKPLYDEDNGVIIVEMQQLDEALEVAEYTLYKNQIENREKSSTSFKVYKAIENLAGVENELYKFY